MDPEYSNLHHVIELTIHTIMLLYQGLSHVKKVQAGGAATAALGHFHMSG